MGFWRDNGFAIGLSVTIAGAILAIIGAWAIWLPKLLEAFTSKLQTPAWDVVLFVAGILMVFTAGWEAIDIISAKKKLLKLLETKKKSEMIKDRSEIRELVKHLPKKYEQMVKAKEEELGIQ